MLITPLKHILHILMLVSCIGCNGQASEQNLVQGQQQAFANGSESIGIPELGASIEAEHLEEQATETKDQQEQLTDIDHQEQIISQIQPTTQTAEQALQQSETILIDLENESAFSQLNPSTNNEAKIDNTAASRNNAFPGYEPGLIRWSPNKPITIRKLPIVDAHLVKGFVSAPIDGTTETYNRTGGVWEWTSANNDGLPGVNYSEYNGNDGLHVSVPEEPFNAFYGNGDWAGYIQLDCDCLNYSQSFPYFDIQPNGSDNHFSGIFDDSINASKVSFFQNKTHPSVLSDLNLLFQSVGINDNSNVQKYFFDQESVLKEHELPLHLQFDKSTENQKRKALLLTENKPPITDWNYVDELTLQTPTLISSQGVSAVEVNIDVDELTENTSVEVKVWDPLDKRRALITVGLQLNKTGNYRVKLDHPNLAFVGNSIALGQSSLLTESPENYNMIITLQFSEKLKISNGNVSINYIDKESALTESFEMRMMLMKGQFSALSESRPWLGINESVSPVAHLTSLDLLNPDFDEPLKELLNSLAILNQIWPENALVNEYHGWVYQNTTSTDYLDEITDQTVVSTNRPEWATYSRSTLISIRDHVEWWLNNRYVEGGMFGGGLNDDTDLMQAWQLLPLVDDGPVGKMLKEVGAELANSVWEKKLTNGVNTTSTDALHAYEEGINQVSLMPFWNPGEPIALERAMISSKSIQKLMVETEDGRLHFGGDVVGYDESINGFELLGETPGSRYWFPIRNLLHPLYVVGKYNNNPKIVDTYSTWGRTWANYQSENTAVSKVDISTGNAVGQAYAGSGPAEQWLALHQITESTTWLDAIRNYIQPEQYWGFHSSFGRTPFSFVDWDSKIVDMLAEQYSGRYETGYTGFYADKNVKTLIPMLRHGDSWYQRFQNMYTTAEQRTDRVFSFNASTAFSMYLGDSPVRNGWVEYVAVNFEGISLDDYASLVWHSNEDSLRLSIHGFSDSVANAKMVFRRLNEGEYRITIGYDTNEDGYIDEVISSTKQRIGFMDTLDVDIKNNQTLTYEITKIKDSVNPHNSRRPDLALSVSQAQHTEPGEASILVHNIGSTPAHEIEVTQMRDSRVESVNSISVLEAPIDLSPKNTKLNFDLVLSGDQFFVDSNNDILEINENNNSLTIH